MIRSILILFLVISSLSGSAQNDSIKKFLIEGEFRPRFEFRDGYRQLPTSDDLPAYFISSRARLNFSYEKKRAAFHASIQDVRIWGQDGKEPSGGLGVFEAYARFKMGQQWWIKLGRQGVELDNGRLFARANWNQFSRAHDGIRLNHKTAKVRQSILLFYNQNNAALFGTDYSVNYYKYLAVHYFTYEPTENWTFKTLNTWDGYQADGTTNTVYVRGTSGGRITYEKPKKWTITTAAYYQYGQVKSGQYVSAFYFQPEISGQFKKLKIRLGMEYSSGSNNTVIANQSRTFSTLYGVAFRFMGHLDYFTNLPNHTNQAGLINPYLFFDYRFTKKWRVKLDFHAFMSENKVVDTEGLVAAPYLGTEVDLTLNYAVNKETRLDFGFSAMQATSSMEILKGGNSNIIPVFSYLMLTWKPTFFDASKNKTAH